MPGPQFFETRMGHTFYEHQLPSLIKAIEENTAAFNKLAESNQSKSGGNSCLELD